MSFRTHLRLVFGGMALLVAVGVGVAASSPLPGAPASARGAAAKKRPNIVVVMTDDQALSQMRPDAMPRTTKVLGDGGTRFSNAFLTTPLCCPSRASLLTGQYGHNNGVLRNSYMPLRHKRNVLPVWLHRAGYVTAHVGKFLNRYHPDRHRAAVAPGWDEWHTLFSKDEQNYYDYNLSVNGKRVHRGRRDRDYATRVFNATASRLVRRYVPRKRPLYLELDEIAPHPGPSRPGARCRGNAVPDPRDTGRFRHEPLPRPPSFNEENVRDKPPFIRRLPKLSRSRIRAETRRYRCGLASLRAVDRGVGHLYRQIRRLGELSRTVFIFYTDNGVFFGEHRIYGGKLYPYEEASRTPLLMRVAARYRRGHARVAQVSEPVANIDLAPTILRLAHARPCRTQGDCRIMDGRSLLGLVRGRTPSWAPRRPLGLELRLEHANGHHSVCQYAGVRLPGVVFVRHSRVQGPGGSCRRDFERERYAVQSDPFELHNLCFGGGACPHDGLQRRLRKLAAKLHHCAGIRDRDPRPSRGTHCG